MNNLLIKITGCVFILSASLMASGPRVSGTVFTQVENEIVAVETPSLISNEHAKGGMVFEIITAALQSENERATLTTYPAQKMVDYYITQGKSLGTLTIGPNAAGSKKKNQLVFPVALIEEQFFYYKPSHPNGIAWNGKLSNLKGLTYGMPAGVDAHLYKQAGMNVVHGTARPLFEKLKTRKVDVVGVPSLVGEDIIDSFFKSDKALFAIMTPNPELSICRIAFNAKNPDAQTMAAKLRTGLSRILKNGQYQEIMEKYEGHAAKHVEEFKILWAKEVRHP